MIQTVNFKVEGMTCAHCSKNVENTFKKIGIDAKVNLSKNSVRFTYDSDKTPLSYIERVIKQQGYTLITYSKKQNKFFNYKNIAFITSLVVLLIAVLGMINMILMDPTTINKHIPFFMFFDSNLIKLIFATLALFIIGSPFFYRSYTSIRLKRVGMDLLISISSFGSYILSIVLLSLNPVNFFDVFKMGTTTYFDVTMMILSIIYIGHLITDIVKNKSGNTLSSLEKLIPNNATKLDENNIETIVDADSLEIDDIILIKAGEVIPCDSVVIEGHGEVDEKILTGESKLKQIITNDEIFLSTTLVSGPIKAKVINKTSDSIMSNIVNESYALDNKKGHLSKLSDIISSWFVPIIILLSFVTFFINYYALHVDLQSSIIYAISVLVISCPCAFGLAVPLSSLNGFYLALKRGILFKSGDTFESVRKIKHMFFDKTGTLTSGEFKVNYCSIDKKYFEVIKDMECYSKHPLSKGIIEFCENSIIQNNEYQFISGNTIGIVNEIPGKGIKTPHYKIVKYEEEYNNLISDYDKVILNKDDVGSVVCFFENDNYKGLLELSDQILSDSKQTITELTNQGIECTLISGDNIKYCKSVGKELGFKEENIYGGVLPKDKAEIINKITDNGLKKEQTCYMGDGINDVLALSSVGLKIASYNASEVTKNKANCLLLKKDLHLIVDALKISKLVYINILCNFSWAILYNLILIPFAMIGKINPTLSSILMIVSSLTLVLNSSLLNLVKFKDEKTSSKEENTINQTSSKIEENSKENNKMNKVTLKVNNMMCQHCEMTIKKLLSNAKLENYEVALENKTVTVLENDTQKVIEILKNNDYNAEIVK